MAIEQGFSVGKRRQSITLRSLAIISLLWKRPDYRLNPERSSTHQIAPTFREVWGTDFVGFEGIGAGVRLFVELRGPCTKVVPSAPRASARSGIAQSAALQCHRA